MERDELVEIGRALKPWGVRGAIKVRSESDIPDRFRSLEEVWVVPDGGGEIRSHRIEWVKDLNDAVVLKLEGIEDPGQAERFRGATLCVAEADRAPLEEGAYYIDDLIGLSVFDPDGEPLGTLEGVFQGSAQDIFRVRTDRGDVLVPAVAEYVMEVDIPGDRVVLRLPLVEEDEKEAGS